MLHVWAGACDALVTAARTASTMVVAIFIDFIFLLSTKELTHAHYTLRDASVAPISCERSLTGSAKILTHRVPHDGSAGA
jgi:hypothetical protein